MHAVVEEPELEPCELFVDLGLLIIEGRTPRPTPRGYAEGPHCTPPYPVSGGKGHVCSQQDGRCVQQENLRKHMLLLWKNCIPISVEVLLCPDCCSNDEKFGEATAGPEPSFVLLEQWNVQMLPRGSTEVSIASRALFQAVRSYLHFSQLGAWYSLSGGESPKNVIYRVCVPGEAFSNKFIRPPEEHSFPTAAAGWNHTMRVSVRALPRRPDGVPRLACPLHDTAPPPPAKNRSPAFDAAGSCGRTSPREQAQSSSSPSQLQQHQQQPPPRRRCSTTTAARGLDSPSQDVTGGGELMLGDSLLDPPQLLEMYPRRYQSPSRSGSPVMETPEHWMFGRGYRGKSGQQHPPRERGRPWKRADPATAVGEESAVGTQECVGTRKLSGCGSAPSRSIGQEMMQARLSECSPVDVVGATSGKFVKDARLSECLDCPTKFAKDSRLGLRSAHFSMSPEETGRVLQSLRLGLRPADPVLQYLFSTERLKPACRCRNQAEPFRLGKDDYRRKTTSCECGGATEVTATSPSPTPSELQCSRTFPHEISTVRTGLLHDVADPVEGICSGDRDSPAVADRSNGRKSDTTLPTGGDKWSAQLMRCRRSKEWVQQQQQQRREHDAIDEAGEEEKIVILKSVLSRSSASAQHTESVPPSSSSKPKEAPRDVPTASDKAKFQRYLDSAACMVFSRAGLPLTSSPAPVRKGTSFDFDVALTSVSAIKHALYDKIAPLDEEESERQTGATTPTAVNSNSSLLGNFEESVLNGRLEPVSVVEGFTAEIGASGSFCPRHVVLPVTVFFYSLTDVDKVSSPYLGHINLGKKGYHVPKNGTIQVTLFNPHETVVKMFVVMYDLRDMPPRCQTFLRQRTLYMPVDASDSDPEARKWLRYLIHLRFSSSKSGRTYLHTDIRIVIFRKSDMDAATVHGKSSYELRSFTRGPSQPQFSPRR